MDIQTGLNPDGYWYALDRNTYDCDCDQDGFFSTSPVGYGRTEAEAIGELIDLNVEGSTRVIPLEQHEADARRFKAEALIFFVALPVVFSLLAYGRSF